MNAVLTESSPPLAEPDLSKSSPQVLSLYPLKAEYRDAVHTLWAALASNPGPRRLQGLGHRYLVALHYNMPKRAEEDGKPMSTEFRDLIYFCRYVGPRPTLKHSLHRMDNDLGYCVGNVEWADKRKQAEVRRTTQHHLYLGRRLTDRRLADVITEKGRKITPEAVKKQRQRLAKDGLPISEITAAIFEKLGLPYSSSTDPVEAWDFPAAFRERLNRLYPSFRGKSESRIQYFTRWLREQIHELDAANASPLVTPAQHAQLTELIHAYKHELQQVDGNLGELFRKRTALLISEASAPFAAHQLTPIYPTPAQPATATNELAIAVSAPSPEELAVQKERERLKKRDRENIAYCAKIILENAPQWRRAPPGESEDIPIELLQWYSNHAFWSLRNRGHDNAFLRDVIIDFRAREIVMPSVLNPEELDLPFDMYGPQ